MANHCRPKTLFCRKSHLAINLGERLVCKIRSIFRIFLHDGFEVSLVRHKSRKLSLNRCECIGACFSYGKFEISVAVSLKFAFCFLVALSREAGINRHQIVDPILALGTLYDGIAVGHGALELAYDIIASSSAP